MSHLSTAARIGIAAAVIWAHTAFALDKPEGRPVLTISGAVSQANSGSNAVFDMKMLEKLPQKTFSTQTPWYPTPVSFTGPLLRDVLAAAGAKGSKIVAVALNDYKTEIPFDDATKFEPIVARLMNDKPMPIREKARCSSSTRLTANPSCAPRPTTTALPGSCTASKCSNAAAMQRSRHPPRGSA